MQQPNQSATVDHIAKELLRIEREVREENGEAEQRLREKCRWERMSRTAVIREWGDPRNWTPQQGTMNPQTQPAITNSAQASNPLVIQPATVEECEFCTPAGYIPHHTYCPNKFRDEKVDAIILEAWQELKEKILCGESFAKRIKPFFARATESLREETRKIKCMYCGHVEGIDDEASRERLTDHILACEKSPLVRILCNLTAGFQPLLDILQKRAGDDVSGWYGSIRIDKEFREALTGARDAAKGNDVKAFTDLTAQLKAERERVKELRMFLEEQKQGYLNPGPEHPAFVPRSNFASFIDVLLIHWPTTPDGKEDR